MPAKQRSAEDLEADNAKVIQRLADKRQELSDLSLQQTADAVLLEAEMQAKLLAEEEARLDAQLAAQRERAGVKTMRDSAPRTSSEIDERAIEEQKVQDEILARAAKVVHESGGTVAPKAENAVPAQSPEQVAAEKVNTTTTKEKA